MPIIEKCPNPFCGKDIGIPESSVGKKVMCPFCKRRFVAGAKEKAKGRSPSAAERLARKRPSPRGRSRREERSSRDDESRGRRRRRPDGARREHEHEARRERAREREEAAQDEAQPLATRPEPFLGLSPEALKIIRISCLAIAVIGAAVGVIVLGKNLMLGGGSPEQLLLDTMLAVQKADENRLWKLMTHNDKRLAERNQADFKTFLVESAGLSETDMARMGPRGLLLACLQSPHFRTHSWQFVKLEKKVSDDAGAVLFDDDAGSTRSMTVVRTGDGWRLAVAGFCLETVKAFAAAKADPIEPEAPSDDTATDAEPD